MTQSFIGKREKNENNTALLFDFKCCNRGGQGARASFAWTTAGAAVAPHGSDADGANVNTTTGAVSLWCESTAWSYRCALSCSPRSPYGDMRCRLSTTISPKEEERTKERKRERVENGRGTFVIMTYDDDAMSCKNSSSDSWRGSASLLTTLLPR